MEEQAFQLGDIRGVLRRRGRLMALIAGSVALIAVFLAAILPNSYVAYTTMLIEPQTISKRLVESGVEAEDQANRLHLMTMQILSRARLSRIIDDLDLYPDLAGEMTREEIIEHMRGQIWVAPVLPEMGTVEPARRSEPIPINTFQLFFRHDDPGTTAAVANRLSSDFIDEHIRARVQVSSDTAEFIESELGRLATRLREVETEIARVKSENVGSLPEDRVANEGRLTRLLEAQRESQRRYSEARSDADFYRQQATVLRSSEGSAAGRSITPAGRLQELDMALNELTARGFTDKHPDVVRTKAEMAQLDARISGEEKSSGALSAAEQEARGLAERAEGRAEAETQELERLQGELDRTLALLANTPRVAEQLDALAREYASLTESFRDYSAKRLEATVAANMERRQKGEQFRILEPAVSPPSPDSPNRPLILGVGLLLGLTLAGAVALALEAMDSSYHEPRSLQVGLRIPVLATIPAIVLDSDRLARRRRQRREALGAAAVTATVLLASLAGYVYVNRPGLFRSDASPEATAPPASPSPSAPAQSGAVPPAPAAGLPSAAEAPGAAPAPVGD